MTVKYYHEMKGLGYGNIMWAEDRDRHGFRMRDGRFSRTHPAAPGSSSCDPSGQYGKSASLDRFRALGYWASCFPEGDGITMSSPDGATARKVAEDIAECFGWDVEIYRDETGKQTGKALATVKAVRP